MDFGKKGLQNELREINSGGKKLRNKSMVFGVKIFLVTLLFIAVVGGFFVYGAVKGILEESPDISSVDVSPKGLATTIYDSDGEVIQTLVGSGANRSLVTYDQLPEDLINAFVAIEDERFWTHEGIDLKGMVRAAYLGLASGLSTTQGASTITQQLIKNNVFDGGSETTLGARVIRKIQEQYLALELEEVMSKELILENYLNTINLGSNCLGVQKAAERYFGKDVEELTLSECAVIASITQNPYKYNPITHPEENAERRAIVLEYMEEQGYITEEEKEEALADDVYTRIAEVNESQSEESTVYSYFVDRLISDVLDDLEEIGYTSEQATSLLYSGGLEIYTTQDSEIQAIVDEEVNDESNYSGVDLKYSFTYSLEVTHEDGSSVTYSTSDIKSYAGVTYLEYDSEDEIYALTESFKDSILVSGDEVEETIDITLQPQVSVVVIDQDTGYVLAITGGRGEKTASLSLNRATNTYRQPGSTFKILAAYAPALELGDTLATVFYDEPYTVEEDGTTWTPSNWYSSSKYAGYANIRQGIIYSMNILAVRCLVEDVTPEVAYQYIESFGINTLIPEDEETSVTGEHDVRATLALGGITQGVTNLQLTGAYAAIANGGTYVEPILYTKILDSDGQVIIDKTEDQDVHQVISEETAFLLTDAMSESMESSSLNGLFSSTSTRAAITTMAAAGKSGTTSDYNDLWFVGYTPYYTMGIWSGFDDNSDFSSSDDTSFHKEIWANIMERITEDYGYVDFEVPDSIVEVEICTKSGKLATSACRADGRSSIIDTEYFVSGTEPTDYCDVHTSYTVCSVSGLLATAYCQNVVTRSGITLPEETTGTTQDDSYTYSVYSYCTTCQYITTTEDETEEGEEGSTEEGASEASDSEASDSESSETSAETSAAETTAAEAAAQ